MPELPEVESFRRFVEDTSLNKRVVKVKLSTRNMLSNTTDKALSAELTGNVIVSAFRHGKFLFLKLKSKKSLMLHFALSGDLDFTSVEESPKFFSLILQFGNKHQLVFSDVRRLGKIALVDDVEAFIQKRSYGADALVIKQKNFVNRVQNKRIAIKTALMDQKVVAGVGNEYADEILFRSRVHPASKALNLPHEKLIEVFKKMKSILKDAVKKNAERAKMKKYFFLDNRKAGLVCPRCEGDTKMESIGGRSSYFCPSCQKLYS